jgi:hypothetical protein
MTSVHRLCAILLVCMTAGFIAHDLAKHEGCIAWCTNIASAGRAD